jgi:hypothetical protein
LLGYLDESGSSIQVDLDIFGGQDHINLVVAHIASILRFDDAAMEFPERLVVFRKLPSERGDDRRVLRKVPSLAKQESLRRVEHGVVGTGHGEIQISIGPEAVAGGHTPLRFA